MRLVRAHARQILSDFQSLPPHSLIGVQTVLKQYMANSRSIGSTERRQIYDLVYHTLRNHRLISHMANQTKLQHLVEHAFKWKAQQCESLPAAIRYSIPEFLSSLLKSQYGDEKASQIFKMLHERRIPTVRVNPLKMQRDQLFQYWYHIPIQKTRSPFGIRFLAKSGDLTSMQEYRKGIFQPQDQGSQQIALEVKCCPGNTVIDYCSGAGGKTLGFAPFMKGKGSVYLHDVRKNTLEIAKQRVKRAGLQNIIFQLPEQRKNIDWIVLDVPCTGTGTLRRHPDLKLRVCQQLINFYKNKQQQIFEEIMCYVGRKTRIVYMTCSILQQQNEEQVQFFKQKYGLKGESRRLLPESSGRDGYFVATLYKK